MHLDDEKRSNFRSVLNFRNFIKQLYNLLLIILTPFITDHTQPITTIAVANWRIPANKFKKNAVFHFDPYSVLHPSKTANALRIVPNLKKKEQLNHFFLLKSVNFSDRINELIFFVLIN